MRHPTLYFFFCIGHPRKFIILLVCTKSMEFKIWRMYNHDVVWILECKFETQIANNFWNARLTSVCKGECIFLGIFGKENQKEIVLVIKGSENNNNKWIGFFMLVRFSRTRILWEEAMLQIEKTKQKKNCILDRFGRVNGLESYKYG